MSTDFIPLKRAGSPELEAILGQIFPVQNLGHVRCIDFLGNDNAIVQMARVSYGEGTKTVNEDRGLIRYLMEHKHTSPFEGCMIKLHLKMPIFVARQWVRHRTASMNEYSLRYSEMRDEFYVPDLSEIQLQSKSNKQGSEEGLSQTMQEEFRLMVETTNKNCMDEYKDSLEAGVAREMARITLPLTAYTEFYWQISLHNLLHFLRLRCDGHAQKQIRDYADVILQMVNTWVPLTAEAFHDFVMESKSFSRIEMNLLHMITQAMPVEFGMERMKKAGLNERQAAAFLEKIKATLYVPEEEEPKSE